MWAASRRETNEVRAAAGETSNPEAGKGGKERRKELGQASLRAENCKGPLLRLCQ